MVGSAIWRNLQSKGFKNLVCRSHKELDLANQSAVDHFFAEERPQGVIHAAGKVGGILANDTYPADFAYQNLSMAMNVIHSAYKHGVKRLLFLGSSCIYPKNTPQPIKEEYLLTSELEKTNEAYAIAKIAGLKLCAYYRRQYGVLFHAAMPCNLYGRNDHYDSNNSHVFPALIAKIHAAKMQNLPTHTLWGTGTPRREFLHADDLAEAIYILLNQKNPPEWINIGYGSDVTIRELAETIKQVVGFEGDFIFDTAKPDGTMKKLMDSSKIAALGWKPKFDLRSGIQDAYKDYLQKRGN